MDAPPTPQSGIGTIRKLTFQSASWLRGCLAGISPAASIVPVMSLPDSSTHLTRPFGCKRARAVRHWDGPSRIPSILPQQEGHQGAPLPRLVHMKYLAVVTVACCDFIGHVLPSRPTLPRDSVAVLGLFNIQIVICHPDTRWDCFSPAEQLQHPTPLPGSISSPRLPLNFKSQTFRLILLLCHCWTSFSNSLISSAIVLPGE